VVDGREHPAGPQPDKLLNLTTYPLADGTTEVAAACPRRTTSPRRGRTLDALTLVATRDASGDWRTAVSGLVRDRHTRPIILVDATKPDDRGRRRRPRAAAASSTTSARRSIQIEFDTGIGTPLVASTAQTTIDNVTSAKGPLTAESGLLVLAHDRTSGMYLHGVVDLGGGRTDGRSWRCLAIEAPDTTAEGHDDHPHARHIRAVPRR
jgi:hypothetical protein